MPSLCFWDGRKVDDEIVGFGVHDKPKTEGG